MKKPFRSILWALTAVVVICVLTLLAMAIWGSPIDHVRATRTARQYLKDNLPNTDYVVKVGYNFPYDYYIAHLTSPSNPEGDFLLSIRTDGTLMSSTYEQDVLNAGNIRNDLWKEYYYLCMDVLTPDVMKELSLDMALADLALAESAAQGDFGTLMPGGSYDVREMGARVGRLSCRIRVETPSPEVLAQGLLDVRQRMDEAGVPFATINFTVSPPRNPNGVPDPGDIAIKDFPYTDIYPEDLLIRVQAAIDDYPNH